MVATKKSTSEQEKGKVRVGKLKLNKETVKGLTTDEQKKVRGGLRDGAYTLQIASLCCTKYYNQYCK